MSSTKLVSFAGSLAVALLLPTLALAAPSASPFPVTIKTGAGTVTLAQRPSRIISLSSTGTEDLFAVGAGKQVVAVDSQSLLPKNAPHTNLSAFSPNAEAIAEYRPDLVVVAFDMNKIVAALQKLNIPVVLVPPAPNLSGVYAQLDQLGDATGHLPQAKTLVAGLRRRVAAIVRSVPHTGTPISVYHEIDPTFYTATSHTFIGGIYKLLGLRNIADPAGKLTAYPKLSAEFIVSANPDLIVLADTSCCGQTAPTVAKRTGWSTISAVVHHHVIGVPDVLASYWGPQIVDFMQTIATRVKAIKAAGG
jgi:iron complex transport system substrate-binding protein